MCIIGFNLFGWAFANLRKAHFVFAMATLFCWLVLGIWYGIGYCPITDWQWEVKTKLGETNLPGSFVKYFIDNGFNTNINAELVDALTVILFAAAIALSVKLNFFNEKKATSKKGGFNSN